MEFFIAFKSFNACWMSSLVYFPSNIASIFAILEYLLIGEKTNVVSLSLVLLGVDVVMDATLQLVRKDGDPLLEILE